VLVPRVAYELGAQVASLFLDPGHEQCPGERTLVATTRWDQRQQRHTYDTSLLSGESID
jgi:hypothetical protein